MDIIRTVYYVHSPWRAKKNFCCFICVSYGPYTLLQNDSFFYIYISEMVEDRDTSGRLINSDVLFWLALFLVALNNSYSTNPPHFYTGRYASAVYVVVVCLCVRPSVHLSVCLSQACVLLRRLSLGSRKQRRTNKGQGLLVFWCLRSRRNANGDTLNGGAK